MLKRTMLFCIKNLFLLSIVILLPIPSSASKLIGVIFSHNIKEDKVIVVGKEKKELYLVKIMDDMPHIDLHIKNIKLGENGGDKEKKGDKRTPIGIYYTQLFMPDEKLPSLYGYGAFPLNYPNIVDKIYNKSGYGIWIHGIGDENKKNTEGCIALDNKYIKLLKNKSIVGSPVIITEKVPFYKKDIYEQRKWGFLNYLKEYTNTWQSNNYKDFKIFYHPKFRTNLGQTLTNYLAIKYRLMKTYPYRRILYDNVKIFEANNSKILFEYNQLYCADNMLSEGTKKLYIINENNSYKIIAEEFTNDKAHTLTKAYILKFIRSWINAWENRNVDEYIKFYDKSFRSGNFDYDSWYNDKKKKFAKAEDIKVHIGKITVNFEKPTLYKVTFTQEYTDGKYSDYGIKTIELSGCISDNKIISETWKKLKN